MSRRRAKWRRPTPTPMVRLQKNIVAAQPQSHDELVTLMKQVAEDVVFLTNGLAAPHGAF